MCSDTVKPHNEISSNSNLNQETIKKYVDTSDKKTQTYLQHLQAKWIYESGLPLWVAEHPAFLEFISALRPSYKVATAKKLSNKLLNNVYSDIRKLINSKIQESAIVGLLVDSWSNVKKRTNNYSNNYDPYTLYA